MIVLVDLNGFSAYFLEILKRYNFPFLCYIPSQEWVKGKLTKEMKYICKMKATVISIFPEEDEFYRKRGISSVYLGHPLVDICPLEESKVKARQF